MSTNQQNDRENSPMPDRQNHANNPVTTDQLQTDSND